MYGNEDPHGFLEVVGPQEYCSETEVGAPASWTASPRGPSTSFTPPSGAAMTSSPAATAVADTPQRIAAPVESHVPSELDAVSLVRLLVGWCGVKCGRPAPSPAWIIRHAVLVMRSQLAVESACRLAQMQRDLSALHRQLESLLKEHEATAAIQQRQPAQQRSLSCERGTLAVKEAEAVVVALGPNTPQALVAILEAAEAVNVEKSGLEERLGALGALGELAQSQQQQLQEHQEQQQHEHSLWAADSYLVAMLGAVAARLGKGAGRKLGGLAEAVLTPRLGSCEPRQLLQVRACCEFNRHHLSLNLV